MARREPFGGGRLVLRRNRFIRFFVATNRKPLPLPDDIAHIVGVATEDFDMTLGRSAAIFSIAAAAMFGASPSRAQDAPDLIFRRSTDFKLLTPNDKLATYGIDDPLVEGVACYYTAHEKGGVAGMFGVAEQTSEVSLSCSQHGAIKFKEKFGQGDQVISERRSLMFKRMHIVRGCDVKRNVLVYMVYSDRLIEGSPENSTSAVAIRPWGADTEAPKCADFVRE